MTTDFVRYTVERLEAQKERTEVKDETLAREMDDRALARVLEIKKAQAPLKWQALEQWMKKHCDDCKGQDGKKLLEFKEMGNDQFEVIEIPPLFDTLRVVFDPQICQVAIKKGRNRRDWASIADKTQEPITFGFSVYWEQLLFAMEYAGVTMSVEQMGQTLIRVLLGPC